VSRSFTHPAHVQSSRLHPSAGGSALGADGPQENDGILTGAQFKQTESGAYVRLFDSVIVAAVAEQSITGSGEAVCVASHLAAHAVHPTISKHAH
jgi:hypothetical protein